jgi:hypothetical protein
VADERRTTLNVLGEAIIVSRGVWHRIEVIEPAHLVHVTPGSGHRPI